MLVLKLTGLLTLYVFPFLKAIAKVVQGRVNGSKSSKAIFRIKGPRVNQDLSNDP